MNNQRSKVMDKTQRRLPKIVVFREIRGKNRVMI